MTLEVNDHSSVAERIKGELGELDFYFRKIPLHQQKFLVVSVLSNSPWLPTEKFEKWIKMKLLSTFQLATLFAKATMHARIFLYVLCDDMK